MTDVVQKEEAPSEKPYVRQCENWLTEYGRWVLPRTESPTQFIFWSGLFALSSVVRRQVFVPKKYLGAWEAAPNLYIMFIGPAGKVRKTTTIDTAVELLEEVPAVTRSPDIPTRELLMNALAKSHDSSMSIVSGEWSEFVTKSGLEMYSFLTNAFDGRRKLSAGTITRGLEFAERPCVNLIAATTPEYVAESMPESVIGGGFASRVVFIPEERVRRRQLYYDELNHEYLKDLKLKLIADLKHIAKIKGEFTLTDEAKAFMEGWYKRTADEGGVADYKMHGYYERRPAYVHKVAMLLHLAKSDSLVLEEEDFQQAIDLMKQIEVRLPKVFSAIGKNPYTVDMNRILAFLEERGNQVEKEEVFRKFYHAAQPTVLRDLIEGLCDIGRVVQVIVGPKTYLKLTKTGKQNAKTSDATSDPSAVPDQSSSDTHPKIDPTTTALPSSPATQDPAPPPPEG